MKELELFKQQLDLKVIEAEMKEHEPVEIPETHTFAGGVYIREIFIPAGTLIMGKRHRGKTCNILMKGELLLYVSEEDKPAHIKGPLVFESPANAKKLAFCLSDAVFMNIHPTEKTDLKEIEEEFIITEEEFEMLEGGNHAKLDENTGADRTNSE